MSNSLFGAHEHPINHEQHEASIKRWPIRHEAARMAERACRAMGVTVSNEIVRNPEAYQAVGTNIVNLETRRPQPAPEANLNLTVNPESLNYDFDAMRRELTQPEAAQPIAGSALDQEAIRRNIANLFPTDSVTDMRPYDQKAA